jgi:hypothetical protein
MNKVPKFPSLEMYSVDLAHMVAATSYLPDPVAVGAIGRAVFKTCRHFTDRGKPIIEGGITVGMFDDNTTPRWALFWAHGIAGVSKAPSKGWTIAHVWGASKDIKAYTHLANLALVPECFASLTDKGGPLAKYLQYHAWKVYGWKPDAESVPDEPKEYERITWRYLEAPHDPKTFILKQIAKASCKRSKILQPLMLSPV